MDFNQIIAELESLSVSGTRVPGFRSRKILVDVDRLTSLGQELRRSVPANIQEAEEILNQKDSIINQAYLEAQRIKSTAEEEISAIANAAQQEHMAKVDESEIVKAAETKADEIKDQTLTEAQEQIQDAQRRAFRVLSEAENAANARRDGADHYAREVLFSLEEQLSDMLGRVRRGLDALRPEAAVQSMDNRVPV